MQAAVVTRIPTDRMRVETVRDPTVSEPDDLVVSVAACGICGTDLHILAGHSYRPELPFVLGHEPVGIVVEAGARARDRWLGRRVTMTLFAGCGQCDQCERGDERICTRLRSISGVLGAWGGYAGFMKIHAAQAVEPPSALSDCEVATLVDCGATAANAVRVALEFAPRQVAIVGAGPIGLLSAEMLRTVGVSVEIVQSSEPRRSAARDCGYPAVASLADLERTPDVVIDCAGSASVLGETIGVLAPRGLYIAAGYAVVPSFDLPMVARKELQLRGVRSGSRVDLIRALDLAATGAIRLPRVSQWPLSAIDSAFDALRAKQVPGKAVIVNGQVASG